MFRFITVGGVIVASVFAHSAVGEISDPAQAGAQVKSAPSAKRELVVSPANDTVVVQQSAGEKPVELMVAASKVTGGNEPAAASENNPEPKRPRAKSVPLDQPVELSVPLQVAPEVTTEAAEAPSVNVTEADGGQMHESVKPLVILNTEVPPSTSTRLSWSPSQSLDGIATPTPVLVVNGASEGPVLCLTAAIHGDELNGIEIVRRVLYNLEPKQLAGTVIGVPIVNLQGFHRGSRYLADRRDLNRYFPGTPTGSSASRIAYSFFNEVVRHCDALVDLHTGSLNRTNMPQLRADLHNPQVVQLTHGFGGTVVLHNDSLSGSLRYAATEAGVPSVTLEAGESMRLQESAVAHGVNGITTLLSTMGMIDRFSFWGAPEPVYYHSVWVRAEQGGILFSNVELGERVNKGDLLGEVTDPISNIKSGIVSPNRGQVIGMALNQVVLPGFASFHIAIAAPEEPVVNPQTNAQKLSKKAVASDTAPDVETTAPDTGKKKSSKPVDLPVEQDVMDVEDDLSGFAEGDDFD